MLFYRCKCGDRQAWGSMPPPQCAKCPGCGSNLALGPDSHREPKEHEFTAVSSVETDEGPKPLTRCRYCHLTKSEIEGREV